MITNNSIKAISVWKRYFTVAALSAALCTVSSCNKNDDNGTGKSSEEIIYVQTNDYNSGKNAVIAYRHNGDGALTQIAGSPFLTGGTGLGNPQQILGPADSDYELWFTSDKKYLLVANSGSNNITVFSVKADGSLTPVPGSPFSSGGETPCSIYVSGTEVHVVNKSQNPLAATSSKPNYNTLTLGADGSLTQVAGAKLETTAGVSPSQTFVSRDGKFAYGCDFLGFMQTPAVGTLRSFANNAGVLSPIESPLTIPETGGALGLWQSPAANVLYVGFPLAGKVGVYSIDAATGKLAYQLAIGAGLAACWIRTNKAGNHLYALNSGINTISVFDASNPIAPVSKGMFTLKQSGPTYTGMGLTFATSEDFSFELSADEQFMYVVSQHTNKDFSVGNYNYLHVLRIAADGTLSEPTEPVQIPVSNMLRPKGVAVNKIR